MDGKNERVKDRIKYKQIIAKSKSFNYGHVKIKQNS